MKVDATKTTYNNKQKHFVRRRFPQAIFSYDDGVVEAPKETTTTVGSSIPNTYAAAPSFTMTSSPTTGTTSTSTATKSTIGTAAPAPTSYPSNSVNDLNT